MLVGVSTLCFLNHVAQAMGAGSNLALTILMCFKVPSSHSLCSPSPVYISCHIGQLDT
jgi:hypothetical protein